MSAKNYLTRPRKRRAVSGTEDHDPAVIDFNEAANPAEVERALETAAFLKLIGDAGTRNDRLMNRLMSSYYPDTKSAAETVECQQSLGEKHSPTDGSSACDDESQRDTPDRKGAS
jgi:hypothetical protein